MRTGNRLVRPFQLLGSGLPRRHGHRHFLPSERTLPHRKGHPGSFGLRAYGLSVAWALVTQPILSKRERISTPTVDPARLEAHVRFLSDPLFPRNYVHLDNLNRAADYIGKELEKTKGEVSYQSYEMKGETYRNVIALFGPDYLQHRRRNRSSPEKT